MSGIMRFLSGVFSLALFLGVGVPAAAQEFQGFTSESPLLGQPSVGNASIVYLEIVPGESEDTGDDGAARHGRNTHQ